MHEELTKQLEALYVAHKKGKPSRTPQLKGLNRHARRRMAALTRTQARKDAQKDKAFAAAVNRAQESIAADELAAMQARDKVAHDAEYDAAIEKARALPPMTPEERDAQARSFAYGNLAIDRPGLTREAFDQALAKSDWQKSREATIVEDVAALDAAILRGPPVLARELDEEIGTCQECGGYDGCHDVFCTNG